MLLVCFQATEMSDLYLRAAVPFGLCLVTLYFVIYFYSLIVGWLASGWPWGLTAPPQQLIPPCDMPLYPNCLLTLSSGAHPPFSIRKLALQTSLITWKWSCYVSSSLDSKANMVSSTFYWLQHRSGARHKTIFKKCLLTYPCNKDAIVCLQDRSYIIFMCSFFHFHWTVTFILSSPFPPILPSFKDLSYWKRSLIRWKKPMDFGAKLCDFVHFINFYGYLFYWLQNGANRIYFGWFDKF